jgi:hypothetical protein
MIDAGNSYSEMAAAIGRSKRAIAHKIHALDLAGECGRRQRAFNLRVEIMGLREMGMTWADIGRRLGRNPAYMAQVGLVIERAMAADGDERRERYEHCKATGRKL